MKKLFALLFVAGTICLVACGQSKEDAEKAKAAEQAKMDSIFDAASKGVSAAKDSLQNDSTANAPMEKMEDKK